MLDHAPVLNGRGRSRYCADHLSAEAARGRAASCTDTFGMGECMQLLP